MAKKVLLLHGWGGSDYPHWQAWLASELARDYGQVSFFEFSNYDFPNLQVWSNELVDHLDQFKPDIVICHSLANTLWFHLCNNNAISTKIQKLFLVAPPSMSCDIEELKSFFPLKTPLKLNSQESLLITSTNDPYLTVEEANTLQKELKIEMKVIDNGGHINTDSGYGKWPWILEKVKSS